MTTDCGGGRFGCKIRDAEAGSPDCDGCTKRKAEEAERRDARARTNYCRLMGGHDFQILQKDEELVIYCANNCEISGAYKAVPR